MQKRELIKRFAKTFNAEQQYGELQKALTHKSFYSEKSEHKSNSRYVFSGMYAFKGKTAMVLYKYIPASGTQLQHFLGNIFKNPFLSKIFDSYNLNEFIRYGKNFDAENYKHIFVFGLLGFICENTSENIIENFIVRNFLLGNENLIPNKTKGDVVSQCNYFSKLLYNKKIIVEIIQTEKGLHSASVKAGSIILSIAISKSYRYAKKKALKEALKLMAANVAEKYTQTEEFQSKKEREEEEKRQEIAFLATEKKRLHQEKVAIKKAENEKRRKKRKEENQIKDIERRVSKKRAKERSQKMLKLQEKRDKELQNLSVSKIRHLQDKQK